MHCYKAEHIRVTQQVIEQHHTGWQAFGNYAPVVLSSLDLQVTCTFGLLSRGEDEELMELAVSKDPMALHFAGPGLRRRRSFVPLM